MFSPKIYSVNTLFKAASFKLIELQLNSKTNVIEFYEETHLKWINHLILSKLDIPSLNRKEIKQISEFWEILPKFNTVKPFTYTKLFPELPTFFGSFWLKIFFSKTVQLSILKLYAKTPILISKRMEELSLYKDVKSFAYKNHRLYQKLFGPEAKITLRMELEVAKSMFLNGKVGHTLRFADTLWFKQERLFGYEHKDTLLTGVESANYYYEIGSYERAFKCYEKLLPSMVKIYGENEEETLKAKSGFAKVLSSRGDKGEAMRIHYQILDWKEENLGPYHPSTLIARSNIAFEYYSQNRLLEAKLEFEDIILLQEKILGKFHEATLFTMEHLARIYYKENGNEEKALKIMKEVVEFREIVLGTSHRKTHDVTRTLIHWQLEVWLRKWQSLD